MPLWIVYATRSRIIRRVILPDPGERLAEHVCAGESGFGIIDPELCRRILPPGAIGPNLELVAVEIERRTGVRPDSARCVKIDRTGRVVGVVNADPDLDSIPEHDLVRDDRAEIGWQRYGAMIVPAEG